MFGGFVYILQMCTLLIGRQVARKVVDSWGQGHGRSKDRSPSQSEVSGVGGGDSDVSIEKSNNAVTQDDDFW